ncbi:mucin-2 [Callithrix jacchus]
MGLPLARLAAVCLALSLARGSELQTEGRTRDHGHNVCSAWGDFHYKTFDGDVFRFPGLCDYNFASDCRGSYKEFAVHLKRGLDQAGATPQVESILLTIKDDTIYLTRHLAVLNGAVVSTPHYSPGLLIEKSDAYTKVYSRAGLALLWNREDAIMLELDSKFRNRTCGLCGDYNGLQSYSEFLSDGVLFSALEFGNMQKINQPDVECKDPEEEPAAASCTEHRAECERLLTAEAFADCPDRVPLEPYLQACQQDRCRCSGGDACVCSTVAEFSRQCSHAGGRPRNWRTASLCPKTCPGNMVYLESGSPCMDTCSHLQVSSLCEEHRMDGCFCPEGTVYDDIAGGGCVPVSQCHCRLHGRLYTPGQGITSDCEQCICNDGRWVCKDLPCPGTCTLEGGSHITTFDGKKFTFHGDCYYVLAKGDNDSYALLGELAPCGSTDKQTCLKTVVLLADRKKNVVVFKSDGSVLLNELQVNLPHVTASFSIFRPSSYHIVVSVAVGLRLQVQLAPVMQLFLTLDQAAQGQVQGLCGNFNGLEGDDFKTASGLVEATGAGFANSWKAQSSCQDKLDWLDDPCSLNIESANYAEHWCSLLKKTETPFGRCHSAVDPAEYYKRCKYDTCNCQNNEDCLCAALSSYARACAAKGVMLWGWRERVCNKDVGSCPSSQVFLYNLTTCQKTCRSLSEADSHCLEGFAPVDGCGCPDHTFLDEKGRCVPLAKCSCYHRGLYLEAGDVVVRQEERCVCQNGKLHCMQIRLLGQSCSAPKIHMDCNNLTALATLKPRALSCQTLAAGYYHTECVSGCVCPDGLMDDGRGGCVVEEECPCVHNKDLYSPGDKIKVDCNTCTCQKGRWACSQAVCHGTCSIYGSGHYVTFDGKYYDFDGHCSYVAVQDYCGQNSSLGSFSIITENVPCGTTGVTCSKAIKIFMGRTELKLEDKHRVVIQRDEGRHVAYTTREVGQYLVVESSTGIIVIWDKRTTVFIKLAPSYKGTVCGLCGNFDDRSSNDFTTRDHMVVSSELDFGNSWKEAPTCPDVSANPEPCSLNPHRRSWAEKQCSILKSSVFSICHSKVDPTPFYEACVHDSCSCDTGGDCECFCSAVASYAQECTKAEACVFWRTPDLCPVFCDYYNPPHECEWHYEPCGNRSFETCRTINGIHSNISVSYLEGCYPRCPKDRPIYDEDLKKCVSADKCGCYIEDTHYPPGASVPTEEICKSCVCTNSSQVVCRPEEGKILNETQDGAFCYWEICGPNGTVEKHFNICVSTTPRPSTLTTFTTVTLPTTPTTFTTTSTTKTPSTVSPATPEPCCSWSEWINENHPSSGSDGGDRETFDGVCSAPEDIECRSVNEPHLSLEELGQKVQCDLSVGFICKNEDQFGNGPFGLCYDYKIRVNCCKPIPGCITSPPTATPPTTTATAPPTATPPTTTTTAPPTTTPPTTTPPTTTTTAPPTATPPTTTTTAPPTTTTTAPPTTTPPTTTTTAPPTATPPTATTTAPPTATPPTTTTTAPPTATPPTTTPPTTTPPTATPPTTTTTAPPTATPPTTTPPTATPPTTTTTAPLTTTPPTTTPPTTTPPTATPPTITPSPPTPSPPPTTTTNPPSPPSTTITTTPSPPTMTMTTTPPTTTPSSPSTTTTTPPPTTTTITPSPPSTTTTTHSPPTPSPPSTTMTTAPPTTTPSPSTPSPPSTTTTTPPPTTTTITPSPPSTTTTTHSPPTPSPPSTTMTTAPPTTTPSPPPVPPSTTPCVPVCHWTGWLDSGKPNFTIQGGDKELIGDTCGGGWAANISCRATMYPDVPIGQLGQTLLCNVSMGLVCKNEDQKPGGNIPMPFCLNYEINIQCCECGPTSPPPTSTPSTPSNTMTTAPPTTTTTTRTPPSTTTATTPPTTTSSSPTLSPPSTTTTTTPPTTTSSSPTPSPPSTTTTTTPPTTTSSSPTTSPPSTTTTTTPTPPSTTTVTTPPTTMTTTPTPPSTTTATSPPTTTSSSPTTSPPSSTTTTTPITTTTTTTLSPPTPSPPSTTTATAPPTTMTTTPPTTMTTTPTPPSTTTATAPPTTTTTTPTPPSTTTTTTSPTTTSSSPTPSPPSTTTATTPPTTTSSSPTPSPPSTTTTTTPPTTTSSSPTTSPPSTTTTTTPPTTTSSSPTTSPPSTTTTTTPPTTTSSSPTTSPPSSTTTTTPLTTTTTTTLSPPTPSPPSTTTATTPPTNTSSSPTTSPPSSTTTTTPPTTTSISPTPSPPSTTTATTPPTTTSSSPTTSPPSTTTTTTPQTTTSSSPTPSPPSTTTTTPPTTTSSSPTPSPPSTTTATTPPTTTSSSPTPSPPSTTTTTTPPTTTSSSPTTSPPSTTTATTPPTTTSSSPTTSPPSTTTATTPPTTTSSSPTPSPPSTTTTTTPPTTTSSSPTPSPPSTTTATTPPTTTSSSPTTSPPSSTTTTTPPTTTSSSPTPSPPSTTTATTPPTTTSSSPTTSPPSSTTTTTPPTTTSSSPTPSPPSTTTATTPPTTTSSSPTTSPPSSTTTTTPPTTTSSSPTPSPPSTTTTTSPPTTTSSSPTTSPPSTTTTTPPTTTSSSPTTSPPSTTTATTPPTTTSSSPTTRPPSTTTTTPPTTTSSSPTTSPPSPISTSSIITTTSHMTHTIITCCVLNDTYYSAGEQVYNGTLGDTCYFVNCSLSCTLEIYNWSCPSTPSPTPTPSKPTPTPSKPTPTLTPSKPTPSTKPPECPDFDPPRQENETWWLCDCLMATCKYNNTVEITEVKCEPPPRPTCSNGLTPVRVMDDNGCCWHWECDCYCTGWGDPHYTTFDGLYYSYQGNCTYVLVEEISPTVDNFGVYIDNYHCDVNDRVSCPRTLIVRHETQEVLVKTVQMMPMRVQVQVNGQVVALPYKKYGLEVYQSGINYVVAVPELGALVSYNGLSFSIRLPYHKFGNNTKGQCGTCTNSTSDDCILPSGEIISNCEAAADQWVVNDPSKPHCPHSISTTKRPAITVPGGSKTTPRKDCTPSPLCQLIKDSLFAECHALVPPQHYYEACVFDSCFVPGSRLECASLQAYAALCAQEGVCLDWRNHTHGACLVECPSHREYQACGPAEEPTCKSSSSQQNNTVPVEGCFCPDGTMNYAPGYDVCVKTCGCVGPDNVPREFGEHFEFDCKDCVCLEGGSGIICQPKRCSQRPVTHCVEDGTYLVTEVNPDDTCCNISICKCNTSLCKEEPPLCPLGFELRSKMVPGRCCPFYWCESKGVCVHENAEYQPGSPVYSSKCQDCVCTHKVDNSTLLNTIACTHVPCNNSCSPGFELVEAPGECCKKCEQTHCIIKRPNNQHIILKPGDFKSDPKNNCTFFSCVKIHNQLISSVSNITCPDFDPAICVPGSITFMPNGCCKTCIPRNETRVPCSTVPVTREISHAGCSKSVIMNHCSGSCGTFVMYSAEAQALEHTCSCCKEEKTSQREVVLNCPHGGSLTHTYTHIESCQCQDTACELPASTSRRARRSIRRLGSP